MFSGVDTKYIDLSAETGKDQRICLFNIQPVSKINQIYKEYGKWRI